MNLEDKLFELREKLKDEGSSNICSDEVIRLLSYYKPSNINDLIKINGIGEVFVSKYGNNFIDLINQEKSLSSVELNDNDKDTISKLENRLVNINKRNSMLYTGKINHNRAIDLYDFDNGVEEYKSLIVNPENNKILLCKNDNPNYKNLIKLLREQKRIITETGNNDLYVGYPFVQGLMGNDSFPIKAPLVLFPGSLIEENNSFYLSFDSSRDVLYNNTLILANNKFRGKNIVLPDNVVEELKQENFISELMSFYNNNGMYISKYNAGFNNFFENSSNDLSNYSTNELEIYDYMVLGIYQSFSTSMQRDFEVIKNKNSVNPIVHDLLSSMYQDKNQDVSESNVEKSNFKEGDITYINDLNYSQECVLSDIKTSSSLVVEGPPGTGKSQMITSLIAQEIKNGKKILMVSEKKQALDVINSRLGELSNYSIVIDAINNKENFYNQVKKILSNDLSGTHYSLTEIDFLVKKIEANMNKLESLQKVMFDDDSFGINIQSIYAKCKNYDFNNLEVLNFYNYLKKNVDKRILEMSYEYLRNLKRKFSDKSNNKNLCGYLEVKKKYEFEKYIRLDITDAEYNNFINYLKLYSSNESNQNGNILSKIILKAKIKKEFINNLSIVSNSGETKILYKTIKNDINSLMEFFDNYEDFKLNKLKFLELNESEIIWFNNLCDILEEKNSSLDEVNIDLYNYLLYLQTEKFERENYMMLNSINSYFDITREINNCINQRKTLEKIIVKNKLIEYLKNLDRNNSKKEIERRSNQLRKLSVSKFISNHKFELFDSINIWMMTPEVVSDILPMEENLFDLVIFDEASQMYIERAIPSIYRAKKILVSGDSKQLKPSSLGFGRTIDDEEEQEAIIESESLLDLAVYKFPKCMLNCHYRSKYEELIAFSNYAFYNGNIYVSPNIDVNYERPIERIMVNGGTFINKQNKEEAREVVLLLKKLLNEKNESTTIGIITFNSPQRDLILDVIEEEKSKDSNFAINIEHEFNRVENGENKSLFVKNIENVQGDERDIIIFSTLYAKNEEGKLSINFGWLNDLSGENRLNVAISRAKEKIYAVTSINTDELNVENSKNRGPKLFKKYLEYVKAISEGNYDLVHEILNSLLENPINKYDSMDISDMIEQLYNILKLKGMNVVKNVGVAGYILDLVILDNNNNYILAIEVDGKLYSYSKIVRERDYHRKKYLESRGWNLYRLWSYNYFKNKDKEVNRIIDIVNKLSQ